MRLPISHGTDSGILAPRARVRPHVQSLPPFLAHPLPASCAVYLYFVDFAYGRSRSLPRSRCKPWPVSPTQIAREWAEDNTMRCERNRLIVDMRVISLRLSVDAPILRGQHSALDVGGRMTWNAKNRRLAEKRQKILPAIFCILRFTAKAIFVFFLLFKICHYLILIRNFY